MLERRPTRVAFDFETHPFQAGDIVPKIVCASVAWYENGKVEGRVVGNGDPPEGGRVAPLAALAELLSNPDIEIVLHGGCFDLACAMTQDETLIRPIYEAVESGRIRDTLIREKFLDVAEHGSTEFRILSDGTQTRIHGYAQAILEKNYGFDPEGKRQEVKNDDEDDGIRLSYKGLDGLPASAYAPEMYEYALTDAIRCLGIADAQDERAKGLIERGDLSADPFQTEPLRVATALNLYIGSAWGLTIDTARHDKVEAEVRSKIHPSKLPLLYSSGIIRPATVGALGARGQPVKDKKESKNLKVLGAIVEQVAALHQIEIPRTSRGPSMASDTIGRLAQFSPVLQEFELRESHMKMLTTDLPRMRAPRVHPRWDVVKKTGRVSSSAAKSYPSMGVQNPHPDARQLVVPSAPNRALFSVDFSSIELVTLAQRLLEVVGWSNLADIINRGVDPHGYLGSALCASLDTGFSEMLAASGLTDMEGVSAAFFALKKATCPEHKQAIQGCPGCAAAAARVALFEKFRKFAKPTGLGFPGGLGPETFVTYARSTFGVVTSVEQASQFREIWRGLYPEMRPYFNFIQRGLTDAAHPGLLAYWSPLGMYRSGCTFTEAANGFGLQTPAAEGGTLAFHQISRESYDESLGSVLFGGTFPLAFIHDEVFGEVVLDGLEHERILRIQAIMVESMSRITPRVRVKTEAVLMDRWSKAAKPTYSPDGRIAVWRHP